MALSRLTCPICLAALKPAQPVEEGARVRCPKCKGAFVAEAERPAEEPAPEAVEAAEEEVPAEAIEAAEDEPPRRTRRDRQDDEDDRPRRTARRREDEEDDEEERPRRKRRRKGGVPVWVWLAGGGVGLLLLCGCCGVGGWVMYSSVLGFGGISATNYTALERGMSESEVKGILGSPTSSTGDLNGAHEDAWKNGTDYITVTFQKGKAVSRSCDIQNSGVIKMHDTGILPW